MKAAAPLLLLLALSVCTAAHAAPDERLEMDTTYVKANKELPKILFVVPWQDLKPGKSGDPTLVLHSLYGNLFDPVAPGEPAKPKQGQN